MGIEKSKDPSVSITIYQSEDLLNLINVVTGTLDLPQVTDPVLQLISTSLLELAENLDTAGDMDAPTSELPLENSNVLFEIMMDLDGLFQDLTDPKLINMNVTKRGLIIVVKHITN